MNSYKLTQIPTQKRSGSRGLRYVLIDIRLGLIILKGTAGPVVG